MFGIRSMRASDSPRRRHALHGAALALAALCGVSGCVGDETAVATASFVRATCSVRGWSLTTQLGELRTVTLLSSRGSAATQYESSAPDVPVRALIARSDDSLLGLDYGARTVQSTTVAEAVARQSAERAQVAQSAPPTATPLGSQVLEGVSGVVRIAGVSGRTYTFRDPSPGGLRTRVTYADGLPRPSRAAHARAAARSPATNCAQRRFSARRSQTISPLV